MAGSRTTSARGTWLDRGCASAGATVVVAPARFDDARRHVGPCVARRRRRDRGQSARRVRAGPDATRPRSAADRAGQPVAYGRARRVDDGDMSGRATDERWRSGVSRRAPRRARPGGHDVAHVQAAASSGGAGWRDARTRTPTPGPDVRRRAYRAQYGGGLAAGRHSYGALAAMDGDSATGWSRPTGAVVGSSPADPRRPRAPRRAPREVEPPRCSAPSGAAGGELRSACA